MSRNQNPDTAIDLSKRAQFRLNSAGTKLNDHELEELSSLAARRGVRPSELIRKLILRELAQTSAEKPASPELTEIMGIRLMLTNLFRPLATGQKLSSEEFDKLLAEVKRRKRSMATDAVLDMERA